MMLVSFRLAAGLFLRTVPCRAAFCPGLKDTLSFADLIRVSFISNPCASSTRSFRTMIAMRREMYDLVAPTF